MATVFKRYSEAGALVQNERNQRSSRTFSISRVLAAMCDDGLRLDGYEREFLVEIGRATGRGYDPQRAALPIELLCDPTIHIESLMRDMSAGSSTAGGNLVGTTVSPINDMMKPWSTVIKAGASVVSGDVSRVGQGNIIIPRISKKIVTYWVNGEGGSLTQSDPEISQVTLSPKTGGALTKFSRLLAKQGNVADALLQQHMLSIVGGLVDSAAIAGTGLNGQPKGIVNTVGVAASTGGPDQKSVLTAECNAAINGNDDKFGYITHPIVRFVMRNSGTNLYPFGTDALSAWKSGPEGGRFLDWPAFVSNACPDDTMVAGPWDDCVITMWGAPVLEINPYEANDFKKGFFAARMLIDCDIAVIHPEAWMKYTGITHLDWEEM